jgi:arylsulfatase
MKLNYCMSKVIMKAIALGSALTMAAGITAYGADNSINSNTIDNTANTKEQTAAQNNEKKPNVIYIILDDIGFSDLGCYGSEIRTPNIDKIASEGLRYNNFNTCPLSSPTRASLLTGRENNSVGMGTVANYTYAPSVPSIQGSVTPKAGMVSEILKDKGYNTYGVGKWHMAPVYTITPAGPFDYWPLAKGFDRFYGFMDGETDQYNPQLVNGNEIIPTPKTDGYTLNEDLIEHAKQYITDQVSLYPDKPFFMNYAFGTGHSPQQVPKNYIDSYDGVYDKGWDLMREERFERQKQLGIVPQNAKMTPSDKDVKPWESLSQDEKKLFTRFMQNYAGYITQADEEVGKLVDYLKEVGQYDNTMIVLIGDNGATKDGGSEGTDSFISRSVRTPSAKELLEKYDLIGGPEMAALYPRGWAQVSNTPFKEYKWSVYQGALRNPLIISWPDRIKDKGAIREQYVHVTDITPTVLDVLDIEAPKTLKGVEQMPMYGTSIASTFDSADAPEVRDTAMTFLNPDRAIYNKGWKAIAKHKPNTSFDDDVWELYNLAEDYTEVNNVADKYPDKLKELQKIFMEEAEKSNILPLKEITAAEKAFVKEDSAAKRSNFKYYPGAGHIAPSATPKLNNNFTITVPVTVEDIVNSGVLVAMGDDMGGYTFYIKDNKLVFLYNKFEKIYKITSDINVPLGKSELKFDFKRTSKDGGIGTLYIDDKNVGSGEVQIAPANPSFEGLDIGKDTLLPVAKEYKDLGEFPFTGKFDYVEFNITKFNPEDIKK